MLTQLARHYKPALVQSGDVPISRFILGCNPFGGFAHQTVERDEEMRAWYTLERVKACYRLAQAAGVTAHVGRVDAFVLRALREYRDEGGAMTLIAQTCPGVGSIDQGIDNALRGNASACFVHGGEMDYRVEHGKTREVVQGSKRIKAAGMLAGVAGHTTATIRWTRGK